MRLQDDVRKCVVFFGFPDSAPGKGGINCIGTGFLFLREQYGYLVTAKHLSHGLGSDPFLIRLNKTIGGSENIHVDGAEWIEHPDPTVDLSAAFLHINNAREYDILYINGDNAEQLATQDRRDGNGIGIGNFTYTIGLFKLLSGEKRNLPVCHFGTIAMMPGDERIPVRDWRDFSGRSIVQTEGFLIEAQSISGLSGSPVFVRPQIHMNLPKEVVKPNNESAKKLDRLSFSVTQRECWLLGLWQGAWQAPPDEIRAAETGAGVVVPLGMGIVVPVDRIVELLDTPKAREYRNEARAEYEARRAKDAATPQSALPVSQSENFGDENL